MKKMRFQIFKATTAEMRFSSESGQLRYRERSIPDVTAAFAKAEKRGCFGHFGPARQPHLPIEKAAGERGTPLHRCPVGALVEVPMEVRGALRSRIKKRRAQISARDPYTYLPDLEKNIK